MDLMVCNEKIIKLKETAQHEERIIKMEQKQKQIEIQTKESTTKKYAIVRKEGVYINSIDIDIIMPKNTKDFILDKILYIGIEKIKLRKSKINDFVYTLSLQ